MNTTPAFIGWKVTWVAFAVAIFAWGVGFSGPGVFLQTLHTTRGWSIATVSAAISAHFLLSATIVIFLGDIHRRFGIARTTITGVSLLALGVVGWAHASEPWQLFAATLPSGAGWALTSGAAINAMVARWFDRDRPKALSLAFNGSSIGGVVFAPLWIGLIAQFGFGASALGVGAVMLAIVVPLAWRFLDLTPADVGRARDGLTPAAHTAQPPSTPTSRWQLVRQRPFVSLSAAFALGLFAQLGIFAHLVTRLSQTFDATGVALAASLTGLCSVAGRTLLGWLIGDRDRRLAASGNFLVQAAGVALLAYANHAPLLLLGCVLFGLGAGNLISLSPLIAQREFARQDVERVVGLVVAINQAVFAFAPAVFGALRDLSAGYALPFALGVGVQLAAAVIVLWRGGARAG